MGEQNTIAATHRLVPNAGIVAHHMQGAAKQLPRMRKRNCTQSDQCGMAPARMSLRKVETSERGGTGYVARHKKDARRAEPLRGKLCKHLEKTRQVSATVRDSDKIVLLCTAGARASSTSTSATRAPCKESKSFFKKQNKTKQNKTNPSRPHYKEPTLRRNVSAMAKPMPERPPVTRQAFPAAEREPAK